MKKLTLVMAIIGTFILASCSKESVAPTHKVTTVADKANLGNADFNGDTPPTNPTIDDKANLGNADGNP